jgi:N,N'-diacetyllegionaminate synthase
MSNHIGVIVACRMKSSRLVKKALLPIAGVPSVERCLEQCLAIKSADTVVLASSDLPDDEILGNYLCGGRVKFWQGDPEDVISRYLGACERYGITTIVRVTADCPLVSYEIAEYLLRSHFDSMADYTEAVNFAVGTSCEIINRNALKFVLDSLGRADYSEYMSWYFRNNPDLFKINKVQLPASLVRDYRLTLDYPEDLELFERLVHHLGAAPFELANVFNVLDGNPKIAELNKHLTLKYKTDQSLIDRLDKHTRISNSPR